jgi:hypothetical protein
MIALTLAAGFAVLLIQQAHEELCIFDRELDSVIRSASRFHPNEMNKPYQKRNRP